MTSDTIVTGALNDIARAAAQLDIMIALVGGEALIAYGVRRDTLDVDLLMAEDVLEAFAEQLVDGFAWIPLAWDKKAKKFAKTRGVTVHHMDDPVLFDIGQERRMIPLLSNLGLPVDMLAAQHPIEDDMVDLAVPMNHHGIRIRVAPLGGILLVKTKADRKKDHAAIEQTTEFLSGAVLSKAVAWARKRDPASADDLQAMIDEVQVRLEPKRMTTKKSSKRAVKKKS